MSMTNGEIKILEFLQKPKDACLRHNKSLGLHLFFCAMQNGWYSRSGIHLHSCVFDTLVRFQRKLSHQKMCNLSKNVCKQNNKNPINLVNVQIGTIFVVIYWLGQLICFFIIYPGLNCCQGDVLDIKVKLSLPATLLDLAIDISWFRSRVIDHNPGYKSLPG